MFSNSHRSSVYATGGMVATSQPLASQVGLSILMQGGNAADAAVAAAAALNVTEPGSTGIGGDMFALHYDAASRQVTALNGSGRSPAGLTINKVEQDGLRGAHDAISDPYHGHCVTVPGAAAGWCDYIARFGSMPLKDILAPAIRLAEKGYPVAPQTAYYWQNGARGQLRGRGEALMIDGRAPHAGEIFKNPGLARTFRELAAGGKQAYYQGDIARAIAAAVQRYGGVMTPEDLAAHVSTWDTPISTTYRGVRVWECPPNGQGLTALIALNILEGFNAMPWSDDGAVAARLHVLIEALRLAFADARWFIADMATNPAPVEALLSKEYARQRRGLIKMHHATVDQRHGRPVAGSDTVYFCVADGAGNAVSFINSNYMGFGTGIVPEGWGFSLQNRGYNFVLARGHANALAPRKRPYHTIIPAMLTRDLPDGAHALWGPFGVMGGFTQPQGHVQVAMNLIDDALDPQTALDRPRIVLDAGTPDSRVAIEDGIAHKALEHLAEMGHNVRPVSGWARSVFGRGQVILRSADGVLAAGSDPRADGSAMGF